MRIAYLIPDTSYHFFRELMPHLENHGHQLIVNPSDFAGFDLAWAAMLPQTPNRIVSLRSCGVQMILSHWDQFSFVDYGLPGWRALFDLLPLALDIWSASYETARQLKASHGLDSFVVGSWVNPDDFPIRSCGGDFVLYAAPPEAFHKRLSWVELACRRLNLQFQQTYQGPHGFSRRQYCELMAASRCYVMAGFEESNATIPALEAALCRKPVLLSDLPACREEFGATATYFQPWSFEDLLEKLAAVYRGSHPPVEEARQRVLWLFDVANVAKRIAERLKELESRL